MSIGKMALFFILEMRAFLLFIGPGSEFDSWNCVGDFCGHGLLQRPPRGFGPLSAGGAGKARLLISVPGERAGEERQNVRKKAIYSGCEIWGFRVLYLLIIF